MRSKAGTSATDKASFERLIDDIQVMIAILTGSTQGVEPYSDYFKSLPCQHELSRAQENHTQVVFVLESAHRHVNLRFADRSCADTRPDDVRSLSSLTSSSGQPIRNTVASRSKRIGALAQNTCGRCLMEPR